jgi:hypothetical protein
MLKLILLFIIIFNLSMSLFSETNASSYSENNDSNISNYNNIIQPELLNLIILDRNYSFDALTPDFDDGKFEKYIFEQRVANNYKLGYLYNLNEDITIYSLDQWLTKKNTKNINLENLKNYLDIQARITQIMEFRPPPPPPKIVPKVTKTQYKPKTKKEEKPKPKPEVIPDWKLPKYLLPPNLPKVNEEIETPDFPDY